MFRMPPVPLPLPLVSSPVPIPRILVPTPLGLQALFNGFADVPLVGCPTPFSCEFVVLPAFLYSSNSAVVMVPERGSRRTRVIATLAKAELMKKVPQPFVASAPPYSFCKRYDLDATELCASLRFV